MKYIKTFESFSQFDIFESISIQDRGNYILIFDSLYNNHLTINEKLMIENQYGIINESWFDELVDKGKRKVLKVFSDAGNLLVDLAQKAKDVLDFAKQLATRITDYLKSSFPNITEKIKSKVLSNNEFLKSLTEFLDKKNSNSLKRGLKSLVDLSKYILGGRFFEQMVTRISECFSKVLNSGTNEGMCYLEIEFLNENTDDVEKKSFLQKLGEAIMKMPPFSWIPRMEELIKKGISWVAKLIDRFFRWIQYGDAIKMNEVINLSRPEKVYGSFKKGLYGRGIYYIFQILELYVFYEINGRVGFLKKVLSFNKVEKDDGDFMGVGAWSNEVKDKAMEVVFKYVGMNPLDAISKAKNAVKSIPYVGDFITILDMLFVGLGVYLAVEPTIKKLM
jgi:hypothetical protein